MQEKSGLWELRWCIQAETLRSWHEKAIGYHDGRCVNWLRVCKETGKVVVHNKKCDANYEYIFKCPSCGSLDVSSFKMSYKKEINGRFVGEPIVTAGVHHVCQKCRRDWVDYFPEAEEAYEKLKEAKADASD